MNEKLKNKKFCITIDFKGSLDPGNRLRPNEKAKTFCEFLLKLTNGGTIPIGRILTFLKMFSKYSFFVIG